MLDKTNRQRDFPGLQEMTYLNTAAEGIPPLQVRQSLLQYFEDKQLGMDGRDRHYAVWDEAKKRIGQLYGLSGDEIGICSSSSEAFNLAHAALQLQPGDEVVINELDFPAGSTPWLQPSSPATVKVWRAREGALRVDDLIPLLGPRTRLVSASLVSFYNGYMIPLPAVVEAVRQHSPALLAVDVTQAVGRIPLDLAGVDLTIGSSFKWLLGSHGSGLVGVPAARAEEWTVPAGGWFNLEDPFGSHRFERVTSQPGAAGFTVGNPNFPAVYAINAAVGYIQEAGVENIAGATQPLVQACLDGLKRLPVKLLTPPEPDAIAGILAFQHPEMDTLHRHLHRAGVHVMHQAGRMRVSIHGYNTMAGIDKFLQTLEKALNHANPN